MLVENERTRVGPGTPMGELLRRHRWPVATHDMAARVPREAPSRVRAGVLGGRGSARGLLMPRVLVGPEPER